MKQYNYKQLARYYDQMELSAGDNYEKLNEFIHKTLGKFKVKKVIDMTCGTGAQTIFLKKKGYNVTGTDISKEMLDIAKKKSKGLNIQYKRADIRKDVIGKFDAVISIFNAIGHLSKKDFEKAIRNISQNLNSRGLYIFDIFNLEFMRSGGFINHEFIDEASTINQKKFVRFNKNQMNYNAGIMTINQRTFVQEGSIAKPNLYKESWDLQLYTYEQLKTLFEKNGFEIINVSDIKGKKFSGKKSLSILTVARKLE